MRKIWTAVVVSILLVGCTALPSPENISAILEESEMKENYERSQPDREGEDTITETLPGDLLFDFQPGTPAWSSVDDSVMGGISESASQILEDGTLEFSGAMSLENNGGFASIQSPWNPIDLTGYDGLLLRVRGDGQIFRLRIRTDGTGPQIAYNSLFETLDGEWTTIYIPFESMIPTYRGFRVPAGRLDPGAVTSLGLMLSDKQPGEFSLQVDWIRAVSEEEISTRLAPTREA